MTHATQNCFLSRGGEHIFGKRAETSFVLAKKDLREGWFCLVCGQQGSGGGAYLAWA